MRRHEFEPARLLIGLSLITVAVLAILEALGQFSWPDWWPLAAVTTGLTTGGLLATLTWGTRRARARAAEAAQSADPEPQLGSMPMDELREEYARRTGRR
ncbi:hypothetical protein SRB5_65500 [Streptomyces sp. RB5]|uniref:Uncharacterized protein n=1 Tax=Streptomyces smaragdinus TaxID=2585196 RepID=A0A7K0CTM0_9ACTN|nr:hypothetical protein [Streptomyces smaragdinus]MQY16352.1 hypothetical protein [Streptomyces smaragdinus]